MRVLCRHGHYAFYPADAAELARFGDFAGLTFVQERDYFTFEGLADLETFSIKGRPYGGFLPATKTYQGEPWEIMRENGFVWSLALEMLVPAASIVNVARPVPINWAWQNDTTLLQAGSLVSGQRVLSFDGELDDMRKTLWLRSMGNE